MDLLLDKNTLFYGTWLFLKINFFLHSDLLFNILKSYFIISIFIRCFKPFMQKDRTLLSHLEKGLQDPISLSLMPLNFLLHWGGLMSPGLYSGLFFLKMFLYQIYLPNPHLLCRSSLLFGYHSATHKVHLLSYMRANELGYFHLVAEVVWSLVSISKGLIQSFIKDWTLLCAQCPARSPAGKLPHSETLLCSLGASFSSCTAQRDSDQRALKMKWMWQQLT